MSLGTPGYASVPQGTPAKRDTGGLGGAVVESGIGSTPTPINNNPNNSWGPSPTTWGNQQESGKVPVYTSGTENAYNYYTSTPEYILAQQQLANSMSNKQSQIDLLNAGAGAQSGHLRKGNDIALQRLGIEEANHNIDLGAARRQPGLVEQMLGIDQGKYQMNDAYVAQLMGLSTEDYQRAMQYLGQQRGFTGQQYDLSVQDANLRNQSANRVAFDDAASRGAVASSGYSQLDKEIAAQLGIDLGNAGLTRDKSIADLDKQGGDLKTDYTREQSGYTNQRGNMKADWDKTDLQGHEDIARAKERVSTLENLSKDFGLRRQELENQLNQGLSNLGLQNQLDIAKLTDLMSQDSVAGMQLMLQVLQASGDAAAAGQFKGSTSYVPGKSVNPAPPKNT
jgi:hypothetical protein